ncbi:MAG: hypothetical protein Q4A72_05065, partial [Bacillota bacterium]|nr:hypothetical protein [Bacillota bacterium]
MKAIKKESENIRIASELLQNNERVSRDVDVLAELIDTDLRESLPPQILAVIAAVFKVVDEMEGGHSV